MVLEVDDLVKSKIALGMVFHKSLNPFFMHME